MKNVIVYVTVFDVKTTHACTYSYSSICTYNMHAALLVVTRIHIHVYIYIYIYIYM